MYDRCGSLVAAREVFDQMTERDVFSWNIIIAAYGRHGYPHEALTMFYQMQRTAVQPDRFTFASVLPACAKCESLHKARYAQNGVVDEAEMLFREMPQRNVVSWSAMIGGYTQNGFAENAMKIFKQMQLAGVKPVSTTFASILPACAKVGVLEQGMDIHRSIIENGLSLDVVVVSALIDMYIKCGSIQKARKLFDKASQRDLVSWTVMIAGYVQHGFVEKALETFWQMQLAGYAQNGFCKDALKLFELMKHSGTYPDHLSFTCVLLACSHAGLVDEGCKYFNSICDSYCIVPSIDQYVCMVDLLGRAGYLKETLNFIIKMPIKPVAVVWMCLLGACRPHENIGLGVFTATHLLVQDPTDATTYVLLSNIYAEVGKWGEVQMGMKSWKRRCRMGKARVDNTGRKLTDAWPTGEVREKIKEPTASLPLL
ncbi:pentatricopeptide repeat-containing protein At3g24000, mitochondrial [Cryptomeria japonica]|uniref:pentatricopeptide repeat-containing protein At3g24000, mitochondrial n=1 Tax=Cryptomeria japonica TaxID=3369 RepID=UPI0025ACCC4A|nr:pentatricopeptide repeat-containing protein At3g24000, mitochondrial [Cryptomeria japonica]